MLDFFSVLFAQIFTGPLFPALTFLLGLFIGHRQALWRDVRKEANQAAEPIRLWLLHELDNPSPYRDAPTRSELDRFVRYLPRWKRKGFLAAWERQQQARSHAVRSDEIGQSFYADSTAIKAAVAECLEYARLR